MLGMLWDMPLRQCEIPCSLLVFRQGIIGSMTKAREQPVSLKMPGGRHLILAKGGSCTDFLDMV